MKKQNDYITKVDLIYNRAQKIKFMMHISLRNSSSDLLRGRMIDRLPLIRDWGTSKKVDEITRDTSGN